MAWRHVNDNEDQMKAAFQRQPLTGRLLGVNLDFDPVKAPRNDPLLYPFLMASSIGDAYSQGKRNDTGYIMAVAVVNTVSPGVMNEPLSRDESRKLFIVNGLMFLNACASSPRGPASLTLEDWTSDITGYTGPPNIPAGIHEALSTTTFSTSDTYRTLTAAPGNGKWVAYVMKKLCERTSNPMIKHAGLQIYVNAFVAFGKRGTITEDKCIKIRDQIRDETGNMITMDEMTISAIYSQLSDRINENNAKEIFDTWRQGVITLSLRMQITLQQVAGSGLTTYNSIRQAIRLFADFPWPRVLRLLQADYRHFTTALDVIRGNEYFGFSSQMANYGSTKYKSLGYVAKELLSKLGGPDYANLPRAGCWTRLPLHKVLLDEIIQTYVDSIESGGEGGVSALPNEEWEGFLDDVRRSFGEIALDQDAPLLEQEEDGDELGGAN